MRRRLSNILRRFGADREGIAAVEFALIAPVMILIYFGMVEFCQAYMASRRANHTASIVADLVAQGDSTTPQNLAKVLDIGALIIKPFAADDLSIRVSSVTLNNEGKPEVEWSRDNGKSLGAHKKKTILPSLPPGMITKGETLILGETRFTYTSQMTHIIKKPLVFERSYYLRPRTSERVSCPAC